MGKSTKMHFGEIQDSQHRNNDKYNNQWMKRIAKI